MVRGDHGTENCVVATLQIAFRMNDMDAHGGSKSFIYGPSTANTVCSQIIISNNIESLNTIILSPYYIIEDRSLVESMATIQMPLVD